LSGSERFAKIFERSFMTEETEKKFAMEVALQKKIDHPNVVRLYEVFKDERAYYLVEE
jgi:calcium-dependent protein kinase